MYTGTYPVTANRIVVGFDVVNAGGAYYYLVPPLFCFLLLSNEIVRDKTSRMRQYLNIVGISHNAFWTSYIITAAVFSSVMAGLMTICGYVFMFEYFL